MFKKLIKKTFLYGFFNLASSSIPFLILPILTNYLTAQGYGIIAIINIIVLLLSIIFRLEINAALKYEYIEEKDNFGSYLGVALTVPIFMTFFFIILLVFFYPFINEIWGIPKNWLFGIVIISGCAACANYLSALYQIKDDPIKSGIWEFFISAPVFLFTFVLIVFFSFDWQGRIWALLITSIFIQLPLSFYYIYKISPYKLSWDIEKLLSMMKFSVPLIPATIIVYVLQVADRIFITEMLGLEIAGLYAVSLQLAMVMELGYKSFFPTWEVFVLENLKKNTNQSYKNIALLFGVFIVGMIVFGVAIILFFPYIVPFIIGKSFIKSMEYFPWLVASIGIRGVYNSLLPFIYYTKKTMIVMYTNVLLIFIYCVLTYFLIRQTGAVGSAQSAFFTHIIGIVIFVYFIRRNYFKMRKTNS